MHAFNLSFNLWFFVFIRKNLYSVNAHKNSVHELINPNNLLDNNSNYSIVQRTVFFFALLALRNF